MLGKKDPNSNPTERLVNKRISSAVSVNYACQNLEQLKAKTKKFLSKYNSIYETWLKTPITIIMPINAL